MKTMKDLLGIVLTCVVSIICMAITIDVCDRVVFAKVAPACSEHCRCGGDAGCCCKIYRGNDGCKCDSCTCGAQVKACYTKK